MRIYYTYRDEEQFPGEILYNKAVGYTIMQEIAPMKFVRIVVVVEVVDCTLSFPGRLFSI